MLDEVGGRLRRRMKAIRERPLRRDRRLREREVVAMNVKNMGHELGRRWLETHPPRPVAASPADALACKATTQADFESDWLAHWLGALKLGLRPHRKLWEFAWILQNLHAHDMMREGRRGIGFGFGSEPLPSFLAARGVEVLATDLAMDEVVGKGWAETGQHASSLDACFQPEHLDRETFDRRVRFRPVDMTAIPEDLDGAFDFAWSICSLEHLGSLAAGAAFMRRSMALLKPGGLSIHTTEFNFREADLTIEEGATVPYRRRDFEALAERLRQDGHRVGVLDFDVGDQPMDRYVDLPPYLLQPEREPAPTWLGGGATPHLKLTVAGFPSTCFGLYAIRGA